MTPTYVQVMVRQESYRKHGYAIQADEEQLRAQIEILQRELSAPTQYKVRSVDSIIVVVVYIRK